jgi:GNAT superfamily N-acetyltransferase
VKSRRRIIVSAATEVDRPAIVALLSAQLAEHRVVPDLKRLSRVVSRILRQKRNGFFLVGRLGKEIVGVAYAALILSIEHSGPVGWLEELYVSPEHRKKGIGRALLDGVIGESRVRGLVAIDLEVDVEHKRVESLYARSGFQRLPRSRWVKFL